MSINLTDIGIASTVAHAPEAPDYNEPVGLDPRLIDAAVAVVGADQVMHVLADRVSQWAARHPAEALTFALSGTEGDRALKRLRWPATPDEGTAFCRCADEEDIRVACVLAALIQDALAALIAESTFRFRYPCHHEAGDDNRDDVF